MATFDASDLNTQVYLLQQENKKVGYQLAQALQEKTSLAYQLEGLKGEIKRQQNLNYELQDQVLSLNMYLGEQGLDDKYTAWLVANRIMQDVEEARNL